MRGYFEAFYSQLCDKLGRVSRKVWRNRYEQKCLKNKGFTILSQNCIGGIMYHDLGQQFRSPTINLLFQPLDFIKFLKNVHWYLEQEIVFVDSDRPYPVGKIGEVTIYFIHYSSEQEVVEAWNTRKNRINWNDVFVICCDEGLTLNDMYEFDKLPYKNKILFVHKDMPHVKSAVVTNYAFGRTDARLLNFANPLGKRYYQKYIDYIGWLNHNNDYRRKKHAK